MSLMVIKRTGEVVDFDRERIRVAIAKAIRATAPRDQWDSLERHSQRVGGRWGMTWKDHNRSWVPFKVFVRRLDGAAPC